MGRKTWESIPEAHRPLKGRINVVLTRNADYEVDEEVLLADSFENGLKVLEMEEIEKIFVVGGGSLYAHTIENPDCEAIYITEIDQTFDCDTFFPEVPEGFEKKALSEPIEEKGIKFQFFVYNKSS